MKSLLILGRQPEIGIAELQSLYGSTKIQSIANEAVLVDVDPCLLDFNRLGGAVKFSILLTKLNSANWNSIEEFLIQSAPLHVKSMPSGKMTLGLNVYGYKISTAQITKSAMKIKKAIQKTGRSVRVVPNNAPTLNTAQIIHNKLTSNNAWDLNIIKSKNETYISRTVKVQAIDDYSLRDRNRPFRDAEVGMLPPKLAQVIVNLASGLLPEEERQSVCETPPDETLEITYKKKIVLDPFCGSGVILQEALLMGYDAYGSDASPRMVEYSLNNLDWLTNIYDSRKLIPGKFKVELANATNYKWKQFDGVASESYLGEPYLNKPSVDQLQTNMKRVNEVITAFLRNLKTQTIQRTRICIAVPAWQVEPNKFLFLPFIDDLTSLGYNSIDYNNGRLIYYRPSQFVARHLLVLESK